MQVKTILTLAYYIIMIITLIVGMIGYNLAIIQGVNINPDTPAATTTYSIIIIYVLASIPFALWLFHSKVKNISKIPNNGERERIYIRFGLIRIILVGLGLIISILAYFLIRQSSLIWLAGIAAIALLFCRPNANTIDVDLNPEDNEESNKIDDIDKNRDTL